MGVECYAISNVNCGDTFDEMYLAGMKNPIPQISRASFCIFAAGYSNRK